MNKTYININDWDRKEVFEHFNNLFDPTFGLVANVDVTKTYQTAKENNQSFFVKYLHACIKAINSINHFKYRIEGDKIAVYETVHASATIARPNNTFGFSQIAFSNNFEEFNTSFLNEKNRIENTTNLFPPNYQINCIHCSAIPWVNFTSYVDTISNEKDIGIPQLSFGQFKNENGTLLMPVSIKVNHALVDGYHVGEFFKLFQQNLTIDNYENR